MNLLPISLLKTYKIFLPFSIFNKFCSQTWLQSFFEGGSDIYPKTYSHETKDNACSTHNVL